MKFKGIDKTLLMGSSIILSVDENKAYNANIKYYNQGHVLGNLSTKGESLLECVSGLEQILAQRDLSEKEQEYISSLHGVNWLLSNGFKINLSKNHQYLGVVVWADDQYEYLKNGLFHDNTCIENGSTSILDSCNGWAETLRKHIEKSATHEVVCDNEEPTA